MRHSRSDRTSFSKRREKIDRAPSQKFQSGTERFIQDVNFDVNEGDRIADIACSTIPPEYSFVLHTAAAHDASGILLSFLRNISVNSKYIRMWRSVMISIVNPPNPPNTVSNKDTMGGLGQLYPIGSKIKMPPLDIPATVAVLRSKGFPFDVFDCLGLDADISGLLLHLHEKKSKFIAIRTSTPSFEWDLRVAKIIKTLTHAEIILFGPHAALYSKSAISAPYIDAIVTGEPETVFPSLVERHGYSGCPGVVYKENGVVVSNPSEKLIKDLSVLPFPAWDAMPYHSYDGAALTRNLRPFVTVLTSRGCPHGCSYCPYPVIQGRTWRARSADNVVAELEWLEKHLGVRAVLFRDPEFALNYERTVTICEGILQKGIRLAWRCETRIENLDENLIRLMARAGCIGINMGVESADEEVLHRMNRKTTLLNKAIKIMEICKKNKIETFCFFVLGLPGETRESAIRSINYALKLNPVFVQFTVATPYPGTQLREWAEVHKYIENDSLLSLSGYEPTMRNEKLTVEEIRSLRNYACSAWEMRGSKTVKRILGHCWGAVLEIYRWGTFQRDKFKLTTAQNYED